MPDEPRTPPPPIEVFEWESYSCNNSSDYRLVAEFSTPAKASAIGAQLTSFFAQHARESDARQDDPDFAWPGPPTQAAIDLGTRFGHAWKKFLVWGDDVMEGDEPEVATFDRSIVIYHSYCGGFGSDLAAVLQKAGGRLPEKREQDGVPLFACELALPSGSAGEKLAGDLATFFAQRTVGDPDEWTPPPGLTLDLGGDPAHYAYWCDGGRAAFTWPLEPSDVTAVQKYLAKRKARDVTLRLATAADAKTIAKRASELDKARAKAEALADKARARSRPKAVAFDPTGKSFLFTGKLATMQRAEAEKRVRELGGTIATSVTKTLGVLVVGDEGSQSYRDDKGDKRRAAEALVAAGANILIVPEASFLALRAAGEEPIPDVLPSLSLVTTPDPSTVSALCGGTFDLPHLFLVGGLGENVVISSSDGVRFSPIKTNGRGLRGISVEGRTVWLCGEYGTLYRSATGFSKLKKIEVGTKGCLHSVARAHDGAIWVGGDEGFLARTKSGTQLRRVQGVSGTIGKLVPTERGLFIPTSAGLYLAVGDKVKKLGLAKPTNHVVLTRAGTIVAACNANTIMRSVDGGKTFRPAKVPAFAPTKVPKARRFARPYWVPLAKDLNVIAALGDGRLVAGGDQGTVLASCDDGETFERVRHDLFGGSVWAIGTWRGRVFLGGENAMVLRAE